MDTDWLLLPLLTSIYAAILDKTRPYWTGGLTWLTVVGGVGLCIGFAEWKTTRTWNRTAATHQTNVRTALIIGAVPVVLWRLVRSTRYGLGR